MPRGRAKRTEPTLTRFDLDYLPRAAGITLRVELVLVAIHQNKPHILMMERENDPCKGGLALIGQHLFEDYGLEVMADLIPVPLGIECGRPHMFGVFADPDRDKCNRAIAVGYYRAANLGQMIALTDRDPRFKLVAFDPGVNRGNNLVHKNDYIEAAFDHHMIITQAIMHMDDTRDYSTFPFELLPPKFTLLELQGVHEALSRRALDKVLFRKRMLARQFINRARLRPIDEHRATAGRPARLYELRRDPPADAASKKP